LGKEIRHNAVCDLAALNKTSKDNQASARTSQPHEIKEGESSVCFGHMKNMDCLIEGTKNEVPANITTGTKLTYFRYPALSEYYYRT
jgi:hypothetical protein